MVPNLRTINHGFEFFAQNHSPCSHPPTGLAFQIIESSTLTQQEKVVAYAAIVSHPNAASIHSQLAQLPAQHHISVIRQIMAQFQSSQSANAKPGQSNGHKFTVKSRSLSLFLSLARAHTLTENVFLLRQPSSRPSSFRRRIQYHASE